jgi:3-isopropylmalate/(R)-2-methylmalate dehydratase small subunit
MIIKGRSLKYGNNINTDIISPPAYMELPIKEAAKYTMSAIDAEFASIVKKGDIFVAEDNVGSGSSRETAPLMLKELGINTIVAKSFARIFYRNCINIGILAIECCETEKIQKYDGLLINTEAGLIHNKERNEDYICDVIPKHILDLYLCGGLVESLKSRKK